MYGQNIANVNEILIQTAVLSSILNETIFNVSDIAISNVYLEKRQALYHKMIDYSAVLDYAFCCSGDNAYNSLNLFIKSKIW